jgi:hypothetical protein
MCNLTLDTRAWTKGFEKAAKQIKAMQCQKQNKTNSIITTFGTNRQDAIGLERSASAEVRRRRFLTGTT